MGYCGECQHWQHKPGPDGMKTSDVGVCDVSGVEAGNMRHGCIMYTQRRKLEESTRSPIENFKLAQANEKKNEGNNKKRMGVPIRFSISVIYS